MELENDDKSMNMNKKTKNIKKGHDNEENCEFVNKVNPFVTVGKYHEKRLQNRLKRINSGNDNVVKSSSIDMKSSPHDICTNKMIRDYCKEFGIKLNRDISDRPLYAQHTDGSGSRRSVINITQSVLYLPTETSNNSHRSDFRSISDTSSYDKDRYKNSFQNSIRKPSARNVSLTESVVINDNKCHNKNANNCAASNDYNEEFVSKTMQKFAKLRDIVKNLVTQRQKEKQRETWNNYINQLKNKHRYYSNESSTISPPYVSTECDQYELLDNYWDARYSYNQSEPCHELLLESCCEDEPNKYDKIRLESKQAFTRNCFYYPISSYGRFMVLNKEIEQSSSMSLTSTNVYNKRRRFMERSCNGTKHKTKPNSLLKTRGVGISTVKSNQEHKKKPTGKTNPTEKIIQTDDRKVTLDEIQQKLDIMIKTFDLTMAEIRKQKNTDEEIYPITKSQSTSLSLRSIPNSKLKIFKDGSNKVLFDSVQHNFDKNVIVSEVGTNTNESKERKRSMMDEIIEEEMKKSEQLKQDLKTLLTAKCYKQKSEEIQFDVPTKEISTVITNSQVRYCPEQEVQVELLNRLVDKEGTGERIAMAVNTEPLGLLALLQVSSGTIKQLLSYLGNLHYNYLSMLSLPRYSSPEHYECNICGGMFGRETELSNHVQNHLGNRRGCCNMLSSRSQPGVLFHCKYCGLKFTRAYCCELHQQECAKLLKKTHDVQTSLMLLR